MNKLIYGLFFIFLLSACAKKYTFDKLPKKQLHFGVGGGFTGKETDYLVLENGQVFMKEPFAENFKEIGKIKSKVAKDYYKQVVAYNNAKVNVSGNAYSFIAMNNDSSTNKMIFCGGMKNDSITKTLLQLHETMLKSMPLETTGRKKDME